MGALGLPLTCRPPSPPPPVFSQVWTTLSGFQDKGLNLGAGGLEVVRKEHTCIFSGGKVHAFSHKDSQTHSFED